MRTFSTLLTLSLLLFLADCSTFRAEETRRTIQVIENDIRILDHAGELLDTVYSGGRRRPNIIRGVERARKGDRLSRNMLPDMLVFVQNYLRKVPELRTQLPEAEQYRRDRRLLLAETDPRASIAIYRKLRLDIERTRRALQKRKSHLARGSAPPPGQSRIRKAG